MTDSGFSRQSLWIIGGLCALSLITGLVISLFQEEIGVVRSAGTDSFSYSALGHRGLKEFLASRGCPVLVSRSLSGRKSGQNGVLIVAEPDLVIRPNQRQNMLWDMMIESPAVLLVLPKRTGVPDIQANGHLAKVAPLSLAQVEAPLKALGIEGTVKQEAGHSRDFRWTEGSWQDQPFIADLQLLEGPDLEPLLACEQGILLGRLAPDEWDSYGETLVLSDPDLLANHGLGKGHNGAIALKIIDHARGPGGPVVFDETLHGHGVSPSIFRSFFRFPLVFILIQVLVSAGILVWMATGRFGSPVRRDPAAGKGLDFLLENTAALLEYGGHGPYILGRYFRASTALVCRRLHLDPPGSGPRARQRLINISQNRSPKFDYSRMSREIPATAGNPASRNSNVLAMARAVWNWQREMTHGL